MARQITGTYQEKGWIFISTRLHHPRLKLPDQELASSFEYPQVGLALSAAWRAVPSTPLCLRTPPPHQPGLPPPGALQKEPGWREEGGRGWGRKGCGFTEGSSNCNGRMGGPSKEPDPHLWAFDSFENNSDHPHPPRLQRKHAPKKNAIQWGSV